MNSPDKTRFTLKLSENDFNRELEEIDRLLVSQEVKIPAREIRGWMLFSNRQGLSGMPMDHPISEKVMSWFKARYGDRLNQDLDFGHSVLLVRDDIFRFRCPLIYGRVYALCCAEIMHRDLNRLIVHQVPLMSVLNLVDGITQAYFNSMAATERESLLSNFGRSETLLARISDVETREFVPEARADIRMSIEQMMLPNPQFGPSKWASLQAVEKFLKAYISQKGTEPRRIHILSELATAAESLGLRTIPKQSLELVQCPASARYQSSLVTKEEAVSAHQAAILICANIATQLTEQSGWKTYERGRALLTLEGIADKVPAIMISRSK
jgi:hypothetical protein